MNCESDMKTMATTVIALLILVIQPWALAAEKHSEKIDSYYSGYDLLDDLKYTVQPAESEVLRNYYRPRERFASGFLLGVWEALQKTGKYCTPQGFTFAKLRDITWQYLQGHRDFLKFRAVDLIEVALADKFPCSKGAVNK